MADVETQPRTSAPASLRTLLSDSVDYAGIFPPARLSLRDAIENFARYRRSAESWMLARFILPASRLPELDKYVDLLASKSTHHFSILPTGGANGDELLGALDGDLMNVHGFLNDRRFRVAVDQFEMRLPREFVGTDVIRVRGFLDAVSRRLASTGLQEADLFFEIPLDENLRQTLPMVTGAMAAFNRKRSAASPGAVGLKLRTGGMEATAFPSAEDVALVIASCRQSDVPFKATAGLHHPFRRFDDALGTHMHGFLNFFCASALASARELDEAGIAAILRDDDPAHFRFSSEGLEWQQLSVPNQQIEHVRSNGALSFGSCSFEEPVEDLRTLGLFQ